MAFTGVVGIGTFPFSSGPSSPDSDKEIGRDMRSFTKKVTLTAAALGLLLPFAACSSPSSTSDDDNAAPIKVGVIGSFSGGSADMGVAMRQGVEIATEEFNAAGGVDGREVQLVFYDDEGDAQKATTGAQHLTDRENVTAVIGNPNTGTAIATVKITQARNVPQIVPIAQSPEVMDGDTTYTFRTSATNPMDIEVLVEYAKSQGWTNIGVLHDTSAYGLSGVELIEPQLIESGLQQVGIERYEVGAVDLTPQALKLRDAGADAVIMWSLGADGARFAINTRGMGWDAPLLGGRGLLFNIFGELGGEAAEGTYATGGFDITKPESAAFAELMQEKFNTIDSIDFAVLGYDAARVLFDAMSRVGADDASDRDKVRDAIEETSNFPTAHGQVGATVSFSPDNHEGASEDAVVVVTYGSDGWSTK